MTQKEEHDSHDHHEGEAMERQTIVIEKGDIDGAKQFLQERAEVLPQAEHTCVGCMDDDLNYGGHDSVQRNPGSYLVDFAQGMAWDQVVELASQFDTFTSHEGCGAAGLIHGMLNKSEVRDQFINAGVFTSQELDAFMAGPSDDFGKAFSEKVAQAAGVEHQHLKVDRVHGHHSAAIAIIDLADLYHSGKSEKSGAYVIHSPKDLVPELAIQASVDTMAQYGLLAETIARGGHSSVKPDQIFTVLIVSSETNADLAEQIRSQISEKMGERNLQVLSFSDREVTQR